MLKSEALIKKFWSGNIRHHELKELEKLLQEQSRNSASTLVEADADDESIPNTLGPKRADELLKKIHTNISANSIAGNNNTKKKMQLLPPHFAGIAASITLAILLTWLWTRKGENRQMKDNMQPVSAIIHQHTENTSDTILNIALPDGSVALLAPKSSLRYDVPFANNKRELSLTGAAEFKVDANRSKPFTVYANGIATTALGTRFRVNAASKNVHVLLYEGKVMIHPAANGSAQKAYLNPGEQLYVAKDFDYRITRIQPTAKAKKILRKEDTVAGNTATMPLNFRNTPLADVFDSLAKKFQIHITYTNREKLQEIPFTGYFNADDSLDNLLKMLCGMNNLQYQLTGDELTIGHP